MLMLPLDTLLGLLFFLDASFAANAFFVPTDFFWSIALVFLVLANE
jgi:hypothetical protein